MATKNYYEAINLYSLVGKPYLTTGSLKSYITYLNALQNELDRLAGPQILEDWILPQIKATTINSDFELLTNVLDLFNNYFANTSIINNYAKSKCQSALSSFTLFILGQYKGNLYMQLDKETDFENCQNVARNAIFCTVDVATKVKNGTLGARVNKRKGNDYYSWFCCGYQRKQTGQKIRAVCPIPSNMPDPQGNGTYRLDDNSQANMAIKNAIIAGWPNWLKTTFYDFNDYMACHIWDKTCYDYRYHTSLFNLVLLPKAIGGLSDYSPIVKEFLQYESTMRFGVYPQGHSYKITSRTLNIYKKLSDEWRQPEEHAIATSNIKNRTSPIAL